MTLKEAIAKAYTKQDLEALYRAYFREWIEKGWVKIPKDSPLYVKEGDLFSGDEAERFATIDPKKTNTVQKQYFIPILSQFYTNPVTFKTIFNSLSDDVRKLYTRVAYERQVPLGTVDAFVIDESISANEKLKDEFRLFNSRISNSRWGDGPTGYLYLHEEIINVIKPWLPKPENYVLNPVKLATGKLMESDFEYEAVVNLHRYRDFAATQVKYGKNGSILKSSYKKLHTNLQIQEFYAADKRLEFMRSKILSTFLDALKDDFTEPTGNAEYLKAIVLLLGQDKIGGKLSLASLFESHLKGCSSYYDAKELTPNIFQTLGQILKQMPLSEWIGFDNIVEFMFYRDLQYKLRSSYYNCYINTYRRDYFDEDHYYSQHTDITNSNFMEYITHPLFKGLMFLLASLGLVKLAYISPFSDNPTFKEGALSDYDGLIAVQITKLGQYAFGIIDEYDEPESIQSDAVIALNNQRLLIALKGDDPIKKFTVENLARKRTGMLYQFDYETLYKGAKSSADVKEKLAMLFKASEGEVPPNWKALETEIVARLNPLKQRTMYVVLELNHDIDLLKVLATDATLKKLIIKAENYMIVAKKSDVSAIKQRLRKYGYFFESR